MKKTSLALAILFCLASTILAQEAKSPIAEFTSPAPDERGSTRILYWDQQKNGAAGEFAVNYGRPAWKTAYEDTAKFDAMTNGKTWRMGNNFWTVLDTNIALKIGGKDIAPGIYYLGLYRSEDGKTWSLAFIDPVKARNAHKDAFEIDSAPIEFKVPMAIEKSDQKEEKLTILLSAPKGNTKEATLWVSWGTLKLSAPIQVVMGG